MSTDGHPRIQRLARAAARHQRTWTATVGRLRRAAFVRRLHLLAAMADAEIMTDISLDVDLGRRLKVEIAPRSRNTLVIGPGCRIRDDVTLLLDGGTVRIGPWSDVRRGVVLSVAGELVLEGSNILSWGTTVHCAGRTMLAELVGASDHVSIVDSTHYFTEPDRAFHRNVAAGTVEIGRNTWLGAKATVTRNSRIGAHCIVAANSLVRGEVPDGHLAVGVPAELRPRDLPWQPGS